MEATHEEASVEPAAKDEGVYALEESMDESTEEELETPYEAACKAAYRASERRRKRTKWHADLFEKEAWDLRRANEDLEKEGTLKDKRISDLEDDLAEAVEAKVFAEKRLRSAEREQEETRALREGEEGSRATAALEAKIEDLTKENEALRSENKASKAVAEALRWFSRERSEVAALAKIKVCELEAELGAKVTGCWRWTTPARRRPRRSSSGEWRGGGHPSVSDAAGAFSDEGGR